MGKLAMTSNRCHSQLCAREVFSQCQPLPCGLAGGGAGVIEVARALLLPVVGHRDRAPVSRRDPLSPVRGARGSVPYAPRRLVPFVSVLVAHLVCALFVPRVGLR